MLEGARVSMTADNALEIVSGNLMLQGSAQTPQLERELERAFGRKLHATVVSPESKEKTDGNEMSAVMRLLQKAEQLQIEVQYK